MINHLVAKAFYVHLIASNKPLHALAKLRLARRVATKYFGSFFFQFTATTWTHNRRRHWHAIFLSRRKINLHHLRNNFTRLLHQHAVTHANVLAPNLLDIVQRGVAHRASTNKHRLHGGARSERAALANLPFNIHQRCALALRWIFKCNRPARRLASGAKLLAHGQRINLHHHSINAVIKLRALLVKTFNGRARHFAVVAAHAAGTGGNAKTPAFFKHFPVCANIHGITFTKPVHGETQTTRAHHGGVQTFQSARSRIAGVHKQLLALFFTLRIHARKTGERHVNFAAHLQHFWRHTFEA